MCVSNLHSCPGGENAPDFLNAQCRCYLEGHENAAQSYLGGWDGWGGYGGWSQAGPYAAGCCGDSLNAFAPGVLGCGTLPWTQRCGGPFPCGGAGGPQGGGALVTMVNPCGGAEAPCPTPHYMGMRVSCAQPAGYYNAYSEAGSVGWEEAAEMGEWGAYASRQFGGRWRENRCGESCGSGDGRWNCALGCCHAPQDNACPTLHTRSADAADTNTETDAQDAPSASSPAPSIEETLRLFSREHLAELRRRAEESLANPQPIGAYSLADARWHADVVACNFEFGGLEDGTHLATVYPSCRRDCVYPGDENYTPWTPEEPERVPFASRNDGEVVEKIPPKGPPYYIAGYDKGDGGRGGMALCGGLRLHSGECEGYVNLCGGYRLSAAGF